MAWTAEDRRKYLQSRGYIAPDNDGFFGELADSAAQSFIAGGRGLGATITELTGNSSMQEYFQGVLDRNQQWNTPEDLGVGGYLGRAVGGAAGSTAATLTAATAGTLLGGPKAGVAAGIATAFSQSFGENVQRNRAAGYSDNKALGMAFLESGLDSVIENLPFGIVGKSGKIIAQAGRLRNISAAGKRELLNKIGQRLSAEVGQKQAQNILVQWGKQAALSGLGEGGEEGLQYLNSYINQTLGGDPNAEFSIDEFANAVAQGILGGFALGGAMTAVTGDGIRRNPALNQLDQTGVQVAPAPEQVAPAVEAMPGNEAAAADNTAVNSLLDELVAGVGEDFGVKVDYTDNYQGEAEVSDGFYDPKTDTIYLDRQDAGAELGITLGHELKHYLDKHHPDLVTAFDKLWQSGQTEDGKAFFADMKKKLKLSDDLLSQKEFGAEVFGRILERPDTMKYYAEALEKQSPGMGEKFIRIFRDFVAAIKKRLAGMYAVSPDMEQLFNNVTAMEQEAGNVLAQLRRRNGNSTQVENVVGAKGNTAVETVPVADINVDAERFQFKSNTSKSSGVDESNKLGGDWDPRTAGNLYLWQDKNGKIYVVNGHHRLELAQRNNVENINAIIDREADGVTAEQARRNGVLINIRDGQGDVRDYAAFVRSEKLSEEEAKAQGVTARSKGRAGYTLGKSGDTLYEAYRNEMIPESKAVIIAEIAQGNEAIEYAGIKLATDRKLAGEALRQTLKLAAENTSGKKVESKQGSLFDMFDDSVLQEWEAIGKIAAGHIKEIRTRIEAAKDAIKNPEAAKSLGVKTSKGAEKLLAQAQAELTRWENYATDPELMAQLRNEAGITPQGDVAGAKNAQTTDTVETNSVVDTPVVKENLTTENAGDLLGISEMENTIEENKVVPEVDKDVDAFLKRFTPQIHAIMAKNKIKARGNQYDDNLESAAFVAAAKAYEDYDPSKEVSLDTFASTYVNNAVIDANRKQYRNFRKTDGIVSLDQPNDDGGTLLDTVADNAQGKQSDSASFTENPEEFSRRKEKFISEIPVPYERRMFSLFMDGVPPSEIARKAHVPEKAKPNIKARCRELFTAMVTEYDLQYRVKDVWTGSGARNYVAFSDQDIQVDEHIQYRKKMLHQQINPVIRDGKVRDEYADLLENKEYTPEKIADWQDKAFEWILRRGGIVQAAKDILGNKAPADGHVAEIARRYILESDVFRNDISRADRTKLYELEIDARSEWGRTGRAMQLAAMQIKDIASVQAILNKLHKNMPPEDVQKLRNQIKDELDIDIFELPESIVNDKSKLDKILRAELAHKASWSDKFYEYWVNGLLSGPGTHVSNFLGNTANAVYELGLKRFTEALVNVAAGRKDGATFGEFKEMLRAFNWDNAKKAFARAWDVELIDPAGKFLENNQTAIGGKTGRIIRASGRLLKAADAMARAIIEPMETAAYAYRMGVQEGLSGKGLADYIAQQLSDPESIAYAWANQRAKEITFQEDPGKSIRALMALKESDGAVGFALRVFLPFLKTPANILKQGVRKSVLGSGSLLVETGKLAMGKRKFDSEYVSRVAEQVIAWGVAMTLYGLSDDDELPFITGSSAAYGSAEYGFKASKVPPYSIRFGNTYLSYQRIEPFATGLAAVADALQAFRNARNGKDGTAVMKDLMNSVQQIILEKSYIDGISEVINFAKDPQRHGSRAATNLLASALPNIYRQSVHALSEDVGESKSRNFGRDWWLDQFFIVTNRAGVTAAVPKIDYFGRVVKKDDWGDTVLSPLGRLLPVKRVDSNMDKAELLIWNYNRRNPNEEYYPNISRNTFTHNGVKMYFAGEDYREFAIQSGQLAHKQINNAIRAGRLNVDNPTDKDIELIRKVFSRARKEIQQKFIQQKKANKK